MKHYLFFAFLCFCSMSMKSQNRDLATRTLLVEYKYRLMPEGAVDNVSINLNLPIDYPGRQKVLKTEFSRLPSWQNQTAQANQAKINFTGLSNEVEFSVKVWLELSQYDLDNARIYGNSGLVKTEKNLKKYLQTSGAFRIKSIDLIPDSVFAGNTPVEKTRSIHNFVVDHLNYHTEFGEDRGAEFALKNKKGDCTEYAELMIALCRMQGIPARLVFGRKAYTPGTNVFVSEFFSSSKHAWVEAYFEDLGWVSFDPTHSDDSDNMVVNFGKRPNQYIYESLDVQYPGGYCWSSSFGNRLKAKFDINFSEVEEDVVVMKKGGKR